ncbi:tRNA (adenosine(37)-N6)-threonylcarbamoyltransferase complex transferase subunit TsaD [bacterium]|nr:tRNA (adenosine(37)-N6)-threonylcarbamoyltransferase complex transferase subunit TsaD [bacterium]
MKILAIDTSCDDTCISILNIKNQKLKIRSVQFKILSNIVSSQVKIHQKYGGVYPSLAKREHQRNLPIVLKKALKEAGFEIFNFTTPLPPPSRLQRAPSFSIFKQIPKSKIPNINFIAVTIGPGLDPCLWTGVNFAKDLAKKWELPIIPVNHIEAHILANFLETRNKRQEIRNLFPAICLVVSGGHTQLILMKKIGDYKIIGETRDDAAGECFDKTARILGLPYPGGPAIATEAEKLLTTHYKLQTKLPRPMLNSKDYDFSFSGLKTAVLYQYKKSKIKNKKYKREMAREIQQAIIDVLIKKTIKAAKNYKARTILLGGGVAANKELRKQFQQKIVKELPNTCYLLPETCFCTDNAAMVGIAGYFNRNKATKNLEKIKAVANLRIY